MFVDIDRRSSKFEKEQQKRREESKKKREREVRLQREQLERERIQVEQVEKRKIEQEEAERQRRALAAVERSLTGGISFTRTLIPYEIDGEDDKVILPEEALSELISQDAPSPMLFQINNGSKTSHCGVREFSAPPGAIGLPKKVLESLTDEPIPLFTNITIKYVRLSKCTYIKLQPKLNNFFEVGPVKLCLEQNLMYHSSITLGDRLTVWYRGKSYELIVVEVKTKESEDEDDTDGDGKEMDVDVSAYTKIAYTKVSDDAVAAVVLPIATVLPTAATLIDTDVEVDLDLSLESTDQASKTSALSAAASSSSSSSSSSYTPQRIGGVSSSRPESVFGFNAASFPSTSTSGTASSSSSSSSTTSSSSTANTGPSIDKTALSKEPDPNAEGVLRMKIKLPSGTTLMRRFSNQSPIYQLFLLVAVEMNLASQAAIESLQVSARFPSRNYKLSPSPEIQSTGGIGPNDVRLVHGEQTLSEVGLTASNEAIFVTMA